MPDWEKKIDELATLLEEYGLTSIRVKEGDLSVEVRRDVIVGGTSIVEKVQEEGVEMPSPMVGIFYRKRSPGEDPIKSEGDYVNVGEVIGLIEAMKVFNEIESSVSGTIVKFFVEDGQLVQQGDPLMLVRP